MARIHQPNGRGRHRCRVHLSRCGRHRLPGAGGIGCIALTSAVASPAAAAGCRSGNPLADVYHPQRLEVISACQTVTGAARDGSS